MHPLGARYLHELEVLLHGIEPVERAEVVEGVREHAGRPSSRPFRRPPVTSRAWLPPTVAGFEALALLVVMFVVGSTATVSSGSASMTTPSGQTITTETQSFEGSIVGAVAALFVSIPFWLVVVVLVGVSALWTVREKAVLMALPLAVASACTLLRLLGYGLVGINGVYVGAWIAVALTVGGGGILAWVLVRRAVRRSEAHAT